MAHEHYIKPDSSFFVPETWVGLKAEVPLALPMPAPDAAGGVGVAYPAQDGVLRAVTSTSLEIEARKRVFCLPKSRVWALSVLDDGEDRLSSIGDLFRQSPGRVSIGSDVSFHIGEEFLGQDIDIALAMPTGVEGMGRMRIEYPRQPGTIIAIFTTSIVLRYEALIKGERQKRLMLLPKSRIWTISRSVELPIA